MKKLFTLLTLCLIFLVGTAQNSLNVTFRTQNRAGVPVPVDSITIENLTRGWVEVLYFPDTTYQLNVGMDVPDQPEGNRMQVMPNPFDGKTSIRVYTHKDEKAQVMLLNLNGKIIAEYEGVLHAGDNLFSISLSSPQTYIFCVQTSSGVRSVKLENTGRGGGNSITYRENIPAYNLKFDRGNSSHAFQLGDMMQYKAFVNLGEDQKVSNPVTQPQNESQMIVLQFDSVLMDGSPCIGSITVSDLDGNVYPTVWIGNQCWMKENLRTTLQADGTVIPSWHYNSFSSPLRYWPDNDSNNVAMYGYLYNYYATMNLANPNGQRGICPAGWHVPSVSDWEQLIAYVSSNSNYFCNGDSANISKALADSTGWMTYATQSCSPGANQPANNATGFSARGAGFYEPRNPSMFNNYCNFWTSTENTSWDNWQFAYEYHLNYINFGIGKYDGRRNKANSVRCIRD